MRKCIPGGMIGLLLLASGCGLDVTGALESSDVDASTPDSTAPQDGNMPPRDGSGGMDSSHPDAFNGVDARTDSPPPPPVDGGADVGVDAGIDSGIDAGVDSGIDAGIDSGIDSGVDAGIDSGIDAGIDSGIDSGVDAGCSTSNNCFVLPSGWSVVAFAQSPGQACPVDYQNPHPVDEGPLSGTNACTCDSCSVTAPSCTTGQIPIHYDADDSKTCGTPFTALQNSNNGGCNQDNYHGAITNQYDIEQTPPAPQGGSCSAAPVTKHPDSVPADRDTVCAADSPSAVGCNGNVCTITPLASPFQECIEENGTQTCPTGLGLDVQHIVGDGVSFDCTACGCTFSPSCTSQTVTYYTDPNCMNNPLAVPADGVCHNQGGTGASYGSYKYTAASNSTCAPGTSTASNLALTGVHTLCCAR